MLSLALWQEWQRRIASSWDFFFIVFGAAFMVSGFRNHTLNDVIFVSMDVANNFLKWNLSILLSDYDRSASKRAP